MDWDISQCKSAPDMGSFPVSSWDIVRDGSKEKDLAGGPDLSWVHGCSISPISPEHTSNSTLCQAAISTWVWSHIMRVKTIMKQKDFFFFDIAYVSHCSTPVATDSLVCFHRPPQWPPQWQLLSRSRSGAYTQAPYWASVSQACSGQAWSTISSKTTLTS